MGRRAKEDYERLIDVTGIFDLAKKHYTGSKAVSFEIEQIPNAAKRADIETLYRKSIQSEATLTPEGAKRAQYLKAQGLGAMDARHLATAEEIGADFLLTVDTDFIRKCNDLNLTIVGVMNPTNLINGGYLK